MCFTLKNQSSVDSFPQGFRRRLGLFGVMLGPLAADTRCQQLHWEQNRGGRLTHGQYSGEGTYLLLPRVRGVCPVMLCKHVCQVSVFTRANVVSTWNLLLAE